MVDGQSILVGGAGLRGFGLPRFSAGYESFRQHDGNRRHELRLLEGHERAPVGGDRLDLWLLDGTELRCCRKRASTIGN